MPTEFVKFFSHLTESAGSYPNTLICMLFLFILFVISACYILIKLNKSDRELIAVARELDTIARKLDPLPPNGDLVQKHQFSAKSKPNSGKNTNSLPLNDVARKGRSIAAVLESFKRHVLDPLRGYLRIGKATADINIKNKKFTSTLLSNSDLKKEILNLINKTDKSISLQHMVKHLSGKLFDGNYHPILNEIEQLEKEGEIEGQLINSKIFYKKKQKTERKYILRKGRNFRKYIG
jgi:hypothetical protein